MLHMYTIDRVTWHGMICVQNETRVANLTPGLAQRCGGAAAATVQLKHMTLFD